MSSTRAERATLVAPVNARIAVSLISLYRLPTDCVVAHSCRNGRRQRWPSAEHMGENRPVGSRARPLAARSAVREC